MKVLFADDALIAVDKPAGRIVIPGRGAAAAEPTLKDELAREMGRPVYVVHRLDRDTTGVLLFALSPEAHRRLGAEFERRDVAKRYLALCAGELIGQGEIARALVAVRAGRVRAARPDEPGKASRTVWRAVERFPAHAAAAVAAGSPRQGFTFVEFRPWSGRLHQIRIHAALLGFPLAVDPIYGGASALVAADLDPRIEGEPARRVVLGRVPLHAAGVRIRHPLNERWLRIEADLPADLEDARALLRGRGR